MAFNIDAFKGRGLVYDEAHEKELVQLLHRIEHERDKESGGIITINMDWESDWDDVGKETL